MPDKQKQLLTVDNLGYAYGPTPALDKVDFELLAGEVVALVGRNGSGKSTLLRCAAGWTRAASGSIDVCGISIGQHERRARAYVTLVPDTPSFWDDLTAWEHLRFVAGVNRLGGWQQEAAALLEQLGLERQRDAFPAAFSRGMRYKLAAAMALMCKRPLLLLDEPFGPLDGESAGRLWEALQQHAARHGGVLFSCHQLPPAAEPDRYVLMEQGKIVVDGSPAQLQRTLRLGVVTPESLLSTSASESAQDD